MEFLVKEAYGSPSSSSSTDPNPNSNANPNPSNRDPLQSWWDSISKARDRIHALSSILTPPSPSLSSLADSDRPARSLLQSPDVYDAVSSSLSSPHSGLGPDPICKWLYETFQSSDPDLRLVALSYIPILSGLYLSRVADSQAPCLAGFEAVLLALYSSESKARGGRPTSIYIPDLSQPSLYHTPTGRPSLKAPSAHFIGLSSPPLEPQSQVKSTKRACIVGVALDCYYKQISQMPSWSKLDLCRFAAAWAGQNCPCRAEFDGNEDAEIDGLSDIRVSQEGDEIQGCVKDIEKLRVTEDRSNSHSEGARIPLPWELLQPTLRIIGHCLLAPLNSQDVKESASIAAKCLYARASHELLPQAILATRSLVQLDKRAREATMAAAAANPASNSNTPRKVKKPELFLVAK